MNTLSPSEVGVLLQSLGFPATADDIEEIAHRLRAYTSALEPLARLDLEHAAPPAAALDLNAT
ncbi:MAG TPA: hypothetical protein VMS64_12090 [Candidatus Methylomirabilis sp.]|nr:hypothetical protein [Candidatus Methylomirabilis sp.]